MRDSLIQRAAWRAVAAACGTLVIIGCGGTEPEPPGGGPAAPSKPVTSCSVHGDVAVGAGKTTSPAIAFHGGRYAIAWVDEGRGGDMMVTIVDDKGRVDRTVAVAKDQEKATAPSITATSKGFLVVWQSAGGAGGRIRAARVDKDGALQGAAYTISDTTGTETHPAVVDTKGGPLVAWTEAQDAVVTLADVAASRSRSTMPAGSQIALAATDDEAAAVWVEGSKLAFSKIAVPPARRAITPMRFRNAPGKANLPRIAAGPDDDHAVVWEDARDGADKEAIYLAHIGDDGKASREVVVSHAGGSANYPDIAWIGDRAAVTYYQYRDGPSAIYLRLVDPANGTVGNEIRVSTQKGARFPRVVWGGGGNLGVTYSERNGPAHVAIVRCQ